MALPPDERRDYRYDDPHYVQCRWCGKWINGSDPARAPSGGKTTIDAGCRSSQPEISSQSRRLQFAFHPSMYVGQSHGIDVVASDALERATAGL
jgi:hypothetical protein